MIELCECVNFRPSLRRRIPEDIYERAQTLGRQHGEATAESLLGTEGYVPDDPTAPLSSEWGDDCMNPLDLERELGLDPYLLPPEVDSKLCDRFEAGYYDGYEDVREHGT
jgi:hypothetical protein